MNVGIRGPGSVLILLLALLCLTPGAATADEAGLDEGALKGITLGDGGATLSLGGEVRTRFESWWNFAFSPARDRDENFVLLRGLLYADLRVNDRVRVFVEGKSVGASDRGLPGGRRTVDVDRLDVQQGYLEIARPTSDGRVLFLLGRQELAFGKQRLISNLPWANSQRAWDTARVVVERGAWRYDAFFGRLAVSRKYDFNDWQHGHSLWGLYGSGEVGAAEDALDVYYVGFAGDDPVVVNGSAGDDRRHTVGARYAGTRGSNDFETEGGYQFGTVGDADVSAWFLAVDLGRTWAGMAWKPRLHLSFDYASGDDRFGDDEVGTFNQLYPLGHAYFGYMDFVGRQNVVDLHPGFRVVPTARLAVRSQLHWFRRAEAADGLYNGGGGLVRGGGATSAREIGQELDVVATYKLNPLTTLEAGYSHFFAGDFLAESGPAEDMDWIYLQAMFTF